MKRIRVGSHVALVDDEDFELVSRFRWASNRNGNMLYALAWRQSSDRQYVAMHRLIMGARRGEQVDHINGHGLDNRRHNLRFASQQQNQFNQHSIHGTSRFKGVWRERRKWRATITLNRQRIHLGLFELESDAARAYDEAARRLFGAFAKTNFD